VRKVNELAQLVRLRDGRLDKEQRMFANDGFLYVGDRVMFQERSKKMGIENSDTATILSIDEKRQRVVVSHDRTGKEIEVDFKSYSISNCKLGYCSTVHKAQGASLPVVHVLLGGPLTDLHMGYVSLSRSIESSHIFTDEQAVGDPAFSDLLRSLSRERQKTMAIDVEHQQKKQQERELQKERQPSLRRMSINF
jgi:ATP-dependent exoDNAse (exonuclease V) alpha subunit